MAGQPAEKAPHHSRPCRRIKMAWNCFGDVLSQTVAGVRDRRHLRSYIAVITYHACSEYFREDYPARSGLRNRIHYFLTHHSEYAVWQSAARTQSAVSCAGATRRWRQRPWKSSRIGRGAQAPRLWSEWIRKPGVPCSLPFFRCWPRPRHWTRPGDKLWVPVQLQRLWIENPAITAPAALSVSAQSHKRGARSLPEQRNRDLQRAFRATEAKNQSGRRQRKQRALACPATTRPVQPSASL
jgi:hypothetical protein